MVKVVMVCTMMHFCVVLLVHLYHILGASEVAPQTTLGPVQPSTLVAEHKAQGVCTCVCFCRSNV